jgi:hypothetical protein
MKSMKFVGYDDRLPMRLLKREILSDARMPLDDSLQTFTAPDDVDSIVGALRERAPRLVVLSLPGPYHLPPFYNVAVDGRITRRDIDSLDPPRDLEEMAEELRALPERTLVDIVDPIWEEGVIAARFMFVSSAEQHLEAGIRCQPREIGLPGAGPSVHLALEGFRPESLAVAGETVPRDLLEGVVAILSAMSEHEHGLLYLAQLGDYPTLEMAFHPRRGVIVIDLDWPVQWAPDAPANHEGERIHV